MLDRTTAPGFVKSTGFELIAPQQATLSNGIDIFFIHGGYQDVIKLELVFRAGRWFESHWGASHFSSHLLSKGTRTKSSYEIAQIFDRYGAHLEVSAGLDSVSIALYSLTRNLAPVLELLKEILLEPVFSDKEFEQSKSIYLQNLKVNLEKTSFLASKHFRRSLFGDTHPYGKELEENDINALRRSHLVDYFQTYFGKFTVFVSGRFDLTDEKRIEGVFSAWASAKAPSKDIQESTSKPVRELIEKEQSVQSSIRMGNRSVLRHHPDYAKTIFVAHILGGFFGSRLMKNIREEKGLTYGIYASLHPLRHGSYLVIGADVNKENIDLTFSEIRKELKRLREEPVSAQEIETARNHFIGSLQSELATPFAHADKWKTIYLFGLPSDYYQQMITKLELIGPEEIMYTSAAHLHEDKFFEIAVG